MPYIHKTFDTMAWLLFDNFFVNDNLLYMSSMMTVAKLLTPLDIVLNDALKMQAIKRPVKPGI